MRLYLAAGVDQKLKLMSDVVIDGYENKSLPLSRGNLGKGNVYSFKYTFIDENKLEFSFLNESIIIDLPFNPEKLVLSGSGIKANMAYSTGECNII
ncbi:hypothetical protein ACCI51_18110 [Microbulbifer echini]|uniref:Uncharacterized protein n=1 Tax=Microbulbifer echini TaxID=1529067 RepID=A0ABV4NSP5_9GAMM